MRTQRIRAEVPADQLSLELPGLPPLRLVEPVPRRPRRPPTAAAAEPVGLASAAVVGERVWLVWEDDEVLGIYADPNTAAADCAALRRAARRAPLSVRCECLPVPVFTGPCHQTEIAEAPPRRDSRWQG